jgi:hypothetical protein
MDVVDGRMGIERRSCTGLCGLWALEAGLGERVEVQYGPRRLLPRS